MTTATPSVAPAAPPGRVRRRPKQPLGAFLLFWVWVLCFFGGIAVFVYWIIEEAGPGGQARLGIGGLVTMAVVLLSWGLLVWRARLLQRLDRKVKAARGAVCLRCHSVLTSEGQEGTCPNCGEAFTLAHNRDVWNKHTP